MANREESERLNQLNMAKNFLELSNNEESCASLRSSGCIPILVQILYASGTGIGTSNNGDDDNDDASDMRKYASQALHNIVHSNPDEKDRRREVKILRLLDLILEYSNFLKTLLRSGGEAVADDEDRHPLAALSLLMKVSFDEEHRNTMCELGALKAIPNLVHLDYAVHGPLTGDTKCCNLLRRYALMTLTNLTFGDENNKAYLCGQKPFMEVMIALLDSAPNELLQVVASVLRNLSWRADKNMKTTFNEISTVTALTQAAMKHKENENTLKAILSALWNLSAHCSTNKAEFCGVNGALAFLVKMLTYVGPSKTLKIVENAGGILRNVSSHIAVCEQYRQILRDQNGLGILLQHLKSDNLTVMSNACGTLWNLSARCPIDQKFLLEHSAIPLLRTLIGSKNSMIAEGSSSALKNLVAFRSSLEEQQIRKKSNISPTNNIQNTNTNSETLKRKIVAVLGSSPNYQQQEQHRSTVIGSTASLPRSMLYKSSRSPTSVYSVKSDSAAMQKTQSQMLHYKGLCGPSRPLVTKGGICVQEKRDAAELNDDEDPIDYSMKYVEHQCQPLIKSIKGEKRRSSFQETDLDQPTNFSMRYVEGESIRKMDDTKKSSQEIPLILDNGTKSYEQIEQSSVPTFAMPKAASTNDLLHASNSSIPKNGTAVHSIALENLEPSEKYQRTDGSHTPERPTHYCEEGTPGYFSRYDSINSLVNITGNEINERSASEETKEPTTPPLHELPAECRPVKKYVTDDQKQAAMLCSAMETPLMFSRRSSMDSLVNEEVGGPCDDNASVTSEYSRMQSGVISPIPDSPTQNMSQYTRPQQITMNQAFMNKRRPISSVFEDDINTFHLENTPAQFSCDTSLSNMSITEEFNNVMQPLELGEDKNLTQVMEVDNNIASNENDYGQPLGYAQAQFKTVCVGVKQLKLDNSIDVGFDIEMHKDRAIAQQMPSENALLKMRRGGSALPGYLPVTDEMNKYGVENSPCNFSVISGLSNLTIESNFAGPAPLVRDCKMEVETAPELPLKSTSTANKGLPVQNQQQQNCTKPPLHDSLSSLSMNSDDDTQLLSQAIAAGSQRKVVNKDTSVATVAGSPPKCIKTDYSSTDSVDTAEDCHSKSLFEQCILSGMHKSSDGLSESTSKSAPRLSHGNRISVMGNLQYNANPSLNRHAKQYATLSPPRRRHSRIMQHDRRRLTENTLILQKRGQSNVARSTGGAGQVNCVSNQVRHFEEMLANTSGAQANLPRTSDTFGRRDSALRPGSVYHQWV